MKGEVFHRVLENKYFNIPLLKINNEKLRKGNISSRFFRSRKNQVI